MRYTKGSWPFIAGDLSLADLNLAPIAFYLSLTPDKDAVSVCVPSLRAAAAGEPPGKFRNGRGQAGPPAEVGSLAARAASPSPRALVWERTRGLKATR